MNAIIPDTLNRGTAPDRLSALRALCASCPAPTVLDPSCAFNNHIHTFYSFSPYSPSAAVWAAARAGLRLAGIMDHDTIAGAREFMSAAAIAGINATAGVECRADFSDTKLAGRRINSPDQPSVTYVAIHAVTERYYDEIRDFFVPVISARLQRGERMAARMNTLTAPAGATIDFGRDVLSLSQYDNGGTVTERHLLFALVKNVISRTGQGNAAADFIANTLGLPLSPDENRRLRDPQNPFVEFDMLHAFKKTLLPRIFIEADSRECPPVADIVDLCRTTGSLCAYAYLGDITQSVTGDKEAQQFEDGFLDLLFDELRRLGFTAVTYMPSRNSEAQLKRVQEMCRTSGFIEISGEDINSPRQDFVCGKLRDPMFAHLADSARRLIGNHPVDRN